VNVRRLKVTRPDRAEMRKDQDEGGARRRLDTQPAARPGCALGAPAVSIALGALGGRALGAWMALGACAALGAVVPSELGAMPLAGLAAPVIAWYPPGPCRGGAKRRRLASFRSRVGSACPAPACARVRRWARPVRRPSLPAAAARCARLKARPPGRRRALACLAPSRAGRPSIWACRRRRPPQWSSCRRCRRAAAVTRWPGLYGLEPLRAGRAYRQVRWPRAALLPCGGAVQLMATPFRCSARMPARAGVCNPRVPIWACGGGLRGSSAVPGAPWSIAVNCTRRVVLNNAGGAFG
jgi:hypothetical protein